MCRLISLTCLLMMTLLLCPACSPQQKATLPFTPGDLQDIYQSYNRQYWGGKLPAATVVWTGLKDRFGETEEEDDGRFLVRLDSVKNQERNVAKTTILHEMCHIRTWKETCHQTGKRDDCRRWLAELHRIMLEGAFDDLV